MSAEVEPKLRVSSGRYLIDRLSQLVLACSANPVWKEEALSSMNEYPPTIVETRDEEEAAPGATLAGRPYRDPATVPAAEVRRSTTILADPGFRALQIVWFLAGVVETIIGIRVLLKALAANPVAG